MKKWRLGVVSALAAVSMLTGVVYAAPPQTVLPQGDYVIPNFSVSSSGRYVAFISHESDLVPDDTNNRDDAFLKDVKTGEVSLISISTTGGFGNADTSSGIVMTGNGRYVLFSSKATNLTTTAGYSNVNKVYLRDIKNETTYIVPAGINQNASPAGLSEDGRFIYYAYQDGGTQLRVWDRLIDEVERIDLDKNGNPSDQAVAGASAYTDKMVSCDGRYVVFASPSTNLDDGDNNGVMDIFIADRMDGNVIKNITKNGNGRSDAAKITCDGNYITFVSSASNLVDGDTNGQPDVFVYDIANETFERASVADDETEYGGSGSTYRIVSNAHFNMSMNGRFVYFMRNKISTNNNTLMVRDLELGTTTQMSSSFVMTPRVTPDNSKVFFVERSGANQGLGNLMVISNTSQ